MTEKKKEKFPKTLLVTHHEERDETEYLMTHDSVEDIPEENDGDDVAIYERKDIVPFKVEKHLLDH